MCSQVLLDESVMLKADSTAYGYRKSTGIILALSDLPSLCDINQELCWQFQQRGQNLCRHGNLIFLPLQLSWVRAVGYGLLFCVATLTVPLLCTADFISRIVKTAVSMRVKCKWKMLENVQKVVLTAAFYDNCSRHNFYQTHVLFIAVLAH